MIYFQDAWVGKIKFEVRDGVVMIKGKFGPRVIDQSARLNGLSSTIERRKWNSWKFVAIPGLMAFVFSVAVWLLQRQANDLALPPTIFCTGMGLVTAGLAGSRLRPVNIASVKNLNGVVVFEIAAEKKQLSEWNAFVESLSAKIREYAGGAVC